MQVVLGKHTPRQTSVEFSWSADPEFNDTKETVKATLGARWDKDNRMWIVPTDQAVDMARRLKAKGHRVLIPDWYGRELEERQRQIDTMADLVFALDLPDWQQPELLVTEPFGFQKVGIRVLGLHTDGFVLGDPTSAGKTIMSIGDTLANGHFTGQPNEVLFLAPPTLKWNIFKEIRKHAPALEEHVTVIEGSKKLRTAQWNEPTAIKIAGYEGYFRFDWGVAPHKWRRVYADEITRVKNYRTVAHERMSRMQVERGIIGISATPIEMRLEELFNIFDVIRPGLLGKWWQFADRFLERDYFNQIVGRKNTDELAALIGPFMLRRDKRTILSQLPIKLPPVTIDVHLDAFERKTYDMISNHFTSWLASRGKDGRSNVLTEMVRSRQFLDCPHLVDPEYPSRSSKLDALEDIITTVEGKTVVFTQFKEMAKILFEELSKVTTVEMITGDTPMNERVAACEQFNKPEHPTRVLVCTDAMAYGVDLIGASNLVHYDQLWNPAKMIEQREGRLERIGQTRQIQVYHLVCKDSIEEVIAAVLDSRMAMAHDVYSGTEQSMFAKWTVRDFERAMQGKVPDAA